jgi:hypothetical protein
MMRLKNARMEKGGRRRRRRREGDLHPANAALK